jgi:hypothetical protein
MELHDYCFESHEAWHRESDAILKWVDEELMKAGNE